MPRHQMNGEVVPSTKFLPIVSPEPMGRIYIVHQDMGGFVVEPGRELLTSWIISKYVPSCYINTVSKLTMGDI